MRNTSSNHVRTFAAIALCMSAALSLLFFSCSKTPETVEKDRFPLIANAADLDSVNHKAGHKMLVLDLYAEWCMPCKLLEPTLHELSNDFKGKAVFYRANVDQSRELAASFGVQGIPFVLFFKDGKIVYSLTGLNPKENYAKVLSVCDDSLSADKCAGELKEKMQN